jgi:hypothetical protein
MLVDKRDTHLATACQLLRAADPGEPGTDNDYVFGWYC